MSKFKTCDYCGETITKIRGSKFDKRKTWNGARWKKPNPLGEPDKTVGFCSDGSYLKEVEHLFLFCRICIECFKLDDLPFDEKTKEYVLPEEIEKLYDKRMDEKTATTYINTTQSVKVKGIVR